MTARTRELAQEWAADGIRVNCVSPGLVRTPLTQPMYDIAATKAAREALVPLHRIAEADADMAGIAAFLLGPDAGYITGHNLLADGGFDWATRFDDAAADLLTRAPDQIVRLREHPDFAAAAPTPDHFIPMLYLAGLCSAADTPANVLVDGYTYGSLSMTSYTLT